MARSAAAQQPARSPHRPARPRQRPQVVHRQRRPRRMRRRLRVGYAVIPVIALLFAGVIFVNSAQLRLTKRQGQVTRQTLEVQEQIASLKSLQARRDLLVRARAGDLGLYQPLTDELNFVPARPTAVAGP